MARQMKLLHKRFDMASSIRAEVKENPIKSSKWIFVACRCDVDWTDWAVVLYAKKIKVFVITLQVVICVVVTFVVFCALLMQNVLIFLNWSNVLTVKTVLSQLWALWLLYVFESRVLRRVLGPKTDEVTGEWRKLHNEELSDLYYLPNIVRVVK